MVITTLNPVDSGSSTMKSTLIVSHFVSEIEKGCSLLISKY